MTKSVVRERLLLAVVALLAVASVSCTAAVRSTTVSTATPAGSLPTIVLVEVNDPTSYIRLDFGELLVERLGARGAYRVVDGRGAHLRFEELKEHPADRAAERFRTRFPADAYLAASVSRCRVKRRVDETNYRTEQDKVWHNFWMWAEGECHATVELVDGGDGHEIATFEESGYADSAKSPDWDQSIRVNTAQETRRSLARTVAAKLVPGLVQRHPVAVAPPG